VSNRILLPVDGSVSSDHAVKYVIGLARDGVELDVHLMNVPVLIESMYLNRFLTREMLTDFYRQEGDKALESASALLDHARVPYRRVVEAGNAAQTIVRYAHAQGCCQIVLGSRGMSAVANLVLGSVAVRVLHLADVPVTLIR
jgi:nucleotide-binding universal stress UspA family protein